VDRESECGAYYNLHRMNLKKDTGPPKITKTLTMCEFLSRCVGHRVDRGTCSTNAQLKNDPLTQVRRIH
jgi:hypothetical protein